MNAQQERKNIPATSGDLGRTSMKRAVIRVEPLSTYLENWKAPTSAVTRSGDTIYVSGFPPFDPDTGKVIKAPIERQTELVLKQMKLCLEMAGSSLAMCIARRSRNLRQSTRSTLDTFLRTRPLESLSAFPHGRDRSISKWIASPFERILPSKTAIAPIASKINQGEVYVFSNI